MEQQPRLIAEERESYGTNSEDPERAVYRERLAEKLRDPEFRKIDGFPIGTDEAILALSDPPYYTACPNPFLPEIIARWQDERRQVRQKLGLPDDSQNGYHREPFAADVSEGKNDPIYNAHSYHTKVPHKAIMRYILHYTDPGDIVFDGFCGSGMTGIAAQLCADRRVVEELGYHVDDAGDVFDGDRQISQLAARKAILVDLSPAAAFIAHNYNSPVDVDAFKAGATRIHGQVEASCGWMYETWHPHCQHPHRVKGQINYVVWSDVFVCPDCTTRMVFWSVGVDKVAGEVLDLFRCPTCRAEHHKSGLERARQTVYDSVLRAPVDRAVQVPVLINYSVARRRYEKVPDAQDLALIRSIDDEISSMWVPCNRMPEGDESRRNDNSGMTHVHHFFTGRNLRTIATYMSEALGSGISAGTLLFALTGALPDLMRTARLRVGAYFHGGRGAVSAGVSGTLYVPSVSVEKRALFGIENRTTTLSSVLRYQHAAQSVAIGTQPSNDLALIPNESVDYLFLDPPFGSNLMYSELNYLWESWLRVFTNNQPEAIVNRTQQKNLTQYQRIMEQCFKELFRVLKPGRWMTVEFHNTQSSVYNAIQEAMLRAGFVLADVRVLDKRQGTFKQVSSGFATKQDLTMTAYKPASAFELRFRSEAGRDAGVWGFVEQHLHHLPLPQVQDGRLEISDERQAYLLYDRMVAFHIQRGLSVPMGAADFYRELRHRFAERDGMYFLPLQTSEYDRLRLRAHQVEQLPLIVTDERSSILWLRQLLAQRPHTYQEIQPQFLRELHLTAYEKLPELRDILEGSCLQDEVGRWYLPDPARAGDIEKLRERSLLREFQEYAGGKGRLKVFRGEAVRAGFRDAWRKRDFWTIISMARRLPERVLQEDADLLMYYDNALARSGEDAS